MLQPKQDRLLIEPIKRVQSAVLEVISNEKFCIGTIIAAGPGKHDKKGRLQPLDVKVGQMIRYGGEQYFQFPEYYDDATMKTYHVIQEADVVGVVEH